MNRKRKKREYPAKKKVPSRSGAPVGCITDAYTRPRASEWFYVGRQAHGHPGYDACASMYRARLQAHRLHLCMLAHRLGKLPILFPLGLPLSFPAKRKKKEKSRILKRSWRVEPGAGSPLLAFSREPLVMYALYQNQKRPLPLGEVGGEGHYR